MPDVFNEFFVPNGPTSILTRISVATGGGQANGPSRRPTCQLFPEFPHPSIAYESEATNLVANDDPWTSRG